MIRSRARRTFSRTIGIDSGFHVFEAPRIEMPAVRAAREMAGTDVELTLEVNCPWTLYEASAKAEELKEIHLKWSEEPLWPPENYDGLAQLRKSCGIPIAARENSSTLIDFERLLAVGAVDFLQPSVAKMGGISELRKVFPIADVRKVTLMPHCSYDEPGLLANIHTTAALGSPDVMIEWRYFDLEAQLCGGAFAPVNGRSQCPTTLAWDSNRTPTSFAIT